MAYALIDKQVKGHTLAEYIVCVNFFTLTLVGSLESVGRSDGGVKRLAPLQDQYRKNASRALCHISVLSPPSLSLLQALLAGVSYIQSILNHHG
jgi:hypothetical protein